VWNHRNNLVPTPPDLPQYGKQITSCPVRLPRGSRVWIKLFVGFGGLVLFPIAVAVSVETFPDQPVLQAIFVTFASVCMGALGYSVATSRLVGQKSENVFVYEGGIHLIENVLYHIPGGHLIEICTGVRHVSIPWRLLKDYRLRTLQVDGEEHFEAAVRLPDGRQMTFATESGSESTIAKHKLHELLG